jgi:AraC-like DNA-binding protein
VSWYAGQLCVSPKHLSYCANAAGGRSAEYWIDNICIHNLVRDIRERPVREVCADYHFSSLSYMSRYVKRLTGLSPREIR